MSATLRPGATFGGYRVEALVGRGGMGVVYRATDLSLQRPVALKLIAPELAEDERFRSRFHKEPRLAASLDHPSVVPIYEAGERDGQLYLAMRYVEGSDLKTIIQREHKLPPERALRLLAQIAGALDAAHRRGLVHRDVKPANVLVDEDGHAYLTDFGITKQVGGDSTDTGRVVGTLDYLAPEQIRGEPVDGRTDCYALACVLYECLSGTPPFRRETEAETLWAHMQEQPAPLRGFPKLEPVLQRALAKERDERYAGCGELIDAASAALGLAAPARRPLAPPALVRRRRSLLVAGLAVLAGAIGAAVALTTGGESAPHPLGNGVAALDSGSGKLASFSETQAAPGNVAVGEGGVWVLNTDDSSVARIDPDTKKLVKTFQPGGRPSEIAAGNGAVWIGNAGGGDATNTTVSVSRVDPGSTTTTRTVKLPGGDAGVFPTAGLPRLAVGAGAVWAVNPDGSVSRIDPTTGRLVARIKAKSPATTIAAGREGVWFVSFDDPSSVTRIDPRTNRVAQKIRVGADADLFGIAVGAGSVWATARGEGVVWRIEPGRDAQARTIDVGVGVTFVAFGQDAVWAGNYVDGSVSRIDPRDNRVTAKTSIGAPQALAAGAGAAWVTVAGGTTKSKLALSACGEMASRSKSPDLLVASDLPLQGPGSAEPRAIANAIRFVLEQHGFRAGRHTIGYQSCDVSTVQTGGFEFRKCAATANAYAHAKRLVAVIGTYSSFCAEVEIPILNRALGGPVPMISPANTASNLTRGGPLAMGRGEPQIFYPTGVRNFFRVIPREDLQGVANALLAKRLGLKRVYELHPSSGFDFKTAHADPFRRAARRLGLEIAGSRGYDPAAKDQDGLARAVARSRASGVFVAGGVPEGGDRVVKALRARLGSRVKIMGTEQFAPVGELLKAAGRSARGMYLSAQDVPPSARKLGPAGQRFERDFGTPGPYVLPAAQATELVVQAIARSDGTRASVLRELRAAKVDGGILGSFRLDRNGDITPAQIPIYRVTGNTPPEARLYDDFQGAVIDRVLTIPDRLTDRATAAAR
jgi:ABC-type branched-subunit amino acid transport system substrate-binding protein/predicted Ser/Thr protein kinase